MFLENVVLGKVCAFQDEELTGVWRKQRNEQRLDLCSFVNVIRWMSRACSTRGREEKFDENLVGNLKERERLKDD